MKIDAQKIIGILLIVILILIFNKLIVIENKADMNRMILLLSLDGGAFDEAITKIAESDSVTSPEQKAINFLMGELK